MLLWTQSDDSSISAQRCISYRNRSFDLHCAGFYVKFNVGLRWINSNLEHAITWWIYGKLATKTAVHKRSRKAILKNFIKLHRKRPAMIFFFRKYLACNLTKKGYHRRYFRMNFGKYFGAAFLKDTSGRLHRYQKISLSFPSRNSLPAAGIYLFKFNNRNTRKNVKYVQSY